jgi:hypothetical protein
MNRQESHDPNLFATEVRNCAGSSLSLDLWSAKVPVAPPTYTLRKLTDDVPGPADTCSDYSRPSTARVFGSELAALPPQFDAEHLAHPGHPISTLSRTPCWPPSTQRLHIGQSEWYPAGRGGARRAGRGSLESKPHTMGLQFGV